MSRPVAAKPRPSKYTRPITRVIRVEGVPLVVTLTDRAIRCRVKWSRKHTYSVALTAVFQAAVREYRARHPEQLSQVHMQFPAEREPA